MKVENIFGMFVVILVTLLIRLTNILWRAFLLLFPRQYDSLYLSRLLSSGFCHCLNIEKTVHVLSFPFIRDKYSKPYTVEARYFEDARERESSSNKRGFATDWFSIKYCTRKMS